MSGWTKAELNNLAGANVLITGANSGIGLQAAIEFAAHGAKVVLSGRNDEVGNEVAERIRGQLPEAQVSWLNLDLASLTSIAAAADKLRSELPDLSVLVNNGGLMVPDRQVTADGFELQFGVNHLGHFALTGQLLPLLLAAPAARVVTITSVMHSHGKIDFDDLGMAGKYDSVAAYGRSKFANILFAFELERRFRAAGSRASSLAAHPGLATTSVGRYNRGLINLSMRIAMLFGQPAARGALPTLYAATAAGLPSGAFVGPDGRNQWRGEPTVLRAHRKAYDEPLAARLWLESARLTGVDFHALSDVRLSDSKE